VYFLSKPIIIEKINDTIVKIDNHSIDTIPHITNQERDMWNAKGSEDGVQIKLDAHTSLINNPHSVTKAQVGLSNVDDLKQATKAEFDVHATDVTNPHKVTKAQIGLANVDDVKQASKIEFDSLKKSYDGIYKALYIDGSLALGLGTTALDGAMATALGGNTFANGGQSVALGSNSKADEYLSIAIKGHARASESISIGGSSEVLLLADRSVAIGDSSTAGGISSNAIGSRSVTTGDYAISMGNWSTANYQSVAIGRYAGATNSTDLAIGYNPTANGNGSIAIGASAQANGENSVAIGAGAIALNLNEGTLGVGTKWKISGSLSVAGTKNFEIPHPNPLKRDTHIIRHGAVESPTAGDTLYRYKIHAINDGDTCVIDLPDYFIHLNKDVQIFVNPQGHFGMAYGILNNELERIEISCQSMGEYNVLVIGTRNDNHESVQTWATKGVEREVGESWLGETYTFEVNEITEIEEISEEVL